MGFYHQVLRSKQRNSVSQFLKAVKFSGCALSKIRPSAESSYLNSSDLRKHHFAFSDYRLHLTPPPTPISASFGVIYKCACF